MHCKSLWIKASAKCLEVYVFQILLIYDLSRMQLQTILIQIKLYLIYFFPHRIALFTRQVINTNVFKRKSF